MSGRSSTGSPVRRRGRGDGRRVRHGRGQPGAVVERDRRAGRSDAGDRRTTRIYGEPPSIRSSSIALRRAGSRETSARSSASPRPPARPASSRPAPAADPFGWKALRGSMGSALRLPVAVELDRLTRSARTRGATAAACIATVPRGRPVAVRRRLTAPGGDSRSAAKGPGCRDRSSSGADERVTIPMAGAGRIAERGGRRRA